MIRKGVNEKSIMGLVDYCRSEGHILRFIEYMDVGTLNSWDIKNVVDSNDILKIISNNYKLSKIEKNYPSETSNRFSFDDGKGEIGFISSISNPFVITALGHELQQMENLLHVFLPILGMNLKSMLRSKKSNEYITSEIINMWKLRDDKYSLERSNSKIKVKNKIEMFQTGG